MSISTPVCSVNTPPARVATSTECVYIYSINYLDDGSISLYLVRGAHYVEESQSVTEDRRAGLKAEYKSIVSSRLEWCCVWVCVFRVNTCMWWNILWPVTCSGQTIEIEDSRGKLAPSENVFSFFLNCTDISIDLEPWMVGRFHAPPKRSYLFPLQTGHRARWRVSRFIPLVAIYPASIHCETRHLFFTLFFASLSSPFPFSGLVSCSGIG